jgi:hypothetical protein
MRSILFSLLLGLTITAMRSVPAAAQVGGLSGTVKDSSGAVLPGARVEVEQVRCFGRPRSVLDTERGFRNA